MVKQLVDYLLDTFQVALSPDVLSDLCGVLVARDAQSCYQAAIELDHQGSSCMEALRCDRIDAATSRTLAIALVDRGGSKQG